MRTETDKGKNRQFAGEMRKGDRRRENRQTVRENKIDR
jgi:hypothetical protein